MTGDGGENLIVLSRLNGRQAHAFDIRLASGRSEQMMTELGLRGLRKVRLWGDLAPVGDRDWRLKARFGATILQDCVVSLEPVRTRIEETVERLYLAGFSHSQDEEVEIHDDSVEPLPDVIDLVEILQEALSLALPPYPRTEGIDLPETVVTEPGAAPLTEEAARPFSALAGLREKLSGDGS